MFSFGGNIKKYSVKRKESKFMIKVLQKERKKGFLSTSGLRIEIDEECEKRKFKSFRLEK